LKLSYENPASIELTRQKLNFKANDFTKRKRGKTEEDGYVTCNRVAVRRQWRDPSRSCGVIVKSQLIKGVLPYQFTENKTMANDNDTFYQSLCVPKVAKRA
jgi:hypothetical protein